MCRMILRRHCPGCGMLVGTDVLPDDYGHASAPAVCRDVIVASWALGGGGNPLEYRCINRLCRYNFGLVAVDLATIQERYTVRGLDADFSDFVAVDLGHMADETMPAEGSTQVGSPTHLPAQGDVYLADPAAQEAAHMPAHLNFGAHQHHHHHFVGPPAPDQIPVPAQIPVPDQIPVPPQFAAAAAAAATQTRRRLRWGDEDDDILRDGRNAVPPMTHENIARLMNGRHTKAACESRWVVLRVADAKKKKEEQDRLDRQDPPPL